MKTTPFSRRRIVASLAAALAAGSLPLGGAAAGFPDKAVTLVVPYPPGGATDVLGRVLAKGLGDRLGQNVLVENKAGAGTAIGAAGVARAPADGYTLLISSNTTFTINPALKAKLPYDPLTSFESIGIIGTSPLVLLAHPSLKANTVAELVALAKAGPGTLSYASFGTGTTSHFAGEMFKVMAGVDITHVPYRGSAPAMQDLIGGQVQLSFDTNVAAKPQVAGGKVKAIALTSARPSKSMPGVPTIAQAGYDGYQMVPWITVVAPRGLPASVSQVLSRALADTVADPAIRGELERAGVDVSYQPPSAYETRVSEELPLVRAYVHKAKLSVE